MLLKLQISKEDIILKGPFIGKVYPIFFYGKHKLELTPTDGNMGEKWLTGLGRKEMAKKKDL